MADRVNVASGVRSAASRMGVDRAVAFTIVGRALTLTGGLLSAVFVVRFLTRVEQGFHYTFLSLLTAHVFFELGFAYTTMQLAAHEKARLDWRPDGTLAGEANALARLATLQRLTRRWTFAVTTAFVVCLVPGGLWFFGHAAVSVPWRGAWVWLVAATAVTLVTSPQLALLEGCGLVARVAAVRAAAIVTSQATLCIALAAGAGLYSTPIAATASAMVPAVWLSMRVPLIPPSSRHGLGGEAMEWRRDIWPLQWRLGLSWLSGFFIYYAFNPIVFRIAGPVEAGRFGLALAVTNTLSTVGLAWVSTRVPRFSALVAERRYSELDALFDRSLRQALAVASALAMALVILVSTFGSASSLSDRLVSLPAFLALVLAALANLVASSEAAYLRAWKRDPFLGISMLTAALVFGGSVLAMRSYGTTGVAVAYLVVMAAVMLGGGHAIFRRCRTAWQRDAP